MYTLKLEHTFAAAHNLIHAYSEECNREDPHGHNWLVKVNIESDTLDNGMIIDFKKIKEVINELDHRYLNKILNFEPTAENLAKYLHDKILIAAQEKNSERYIAVEIEIFEGDKASITYSKTNV